MNLMVALSNFCSLLNALDYPIKAVILQTRHISLQILQWTCVNAEIGIFLSLQKHNCLLQSAAGKTASLNEP